MRNKLRNISLYIDDSMTANLSSLCSALCSKWEIRKRLTDYIELTFYTSNSNNLFKNKINCVFLFQITLYVRMGNKLNQTKFEGYFFPKTHQTAFLYYFIWNHCFIVSDPFIVYNLFFENFAVKLAVNHKKAVILYLSNRKPSIQKSKLVGLLLLHNTSLYTSSMIPSVKKYTFRSFLMSVFCIYSANLIENIL
jgi:hypothetical protein